jgi:hypothetical protein
VIDVVVSFFAVMVLLLTVVLCRDHERCPDGWWVEGVRPSGVYDCRHVPVGDDVRLPGGLVEDRSVQPPGVLDGRIFCVAGSEPRVIDARTVACRKDSR